MAVDINPGVPTVVSRLGYEDSCRRLQDGFIDVGDIPPMPSRMPRHDDEDPLGVSFFKTEIEAGDMSNLTLPRTFFGRSGVNGMAFRNTDFSESSVCWNDFINVDFTGAVLARCDLRATFFSKVNFTLADLQDSDFRHAGFEDCNFLDARMCGVVITLAQGEALALSDAQRTQIAWAVEDGPEPDGG